MHRTIRTKHNINKSNNIADSLSNNHKSKKNRHPSSSPITDTDSEFDSEPIRLIGAEQLYDGTNQFSYNHAIYDFQQFDVNLALL